MVLGINSDQSKEHQIDGLAHADGRAFLGIYPLRWTAPDGAALLPAMGATRG